MSDSNAKPTTMYDQMRADLAARQAARAARMAARAAAGDPIAMRMQAARERAEAMQRLIDDREHERVVRLLGLVPGSAPKRPERVKTVPDDPRGLLDANHAAARLNITTEQLLAHVGDGAIRYINIGRGTKRPRYRFDPADLDAFKESRSTLEQPTCPSLSPKRASRITGIASKSNVVGFTALRAARLAKKPNGSKR